MALVSEHKQILEAVFDYFDREGEWPLIRNFEVDFRHLGNIRNMLKSIGSELFYLDNENINSKDGRVKLRLKGLAQCNKSEPILKDFIRALKLFAKTYIQEPLNPKISASDIISKLELTDLQFKKVSQLVYEAMGIWISISERDTSQNIEISPTVLPFESIQTFSEYLDIVDAKNKTGVHYANAFSSYSTDSLRRFMLDYPIPNKAAFIIMSFQKTSAHEKITTALKETLRQHDITALRADEKSYADDLWPNVVTYLQGCGFGIAVLERLQQDDFNPNVSLEIGYMLASNKPICLLKDKTIRDLQSDLTGKLYHNFDTQDPEGSIPSVLNKWLQDKGFIK